MHRNRSIWVVVAILLVASWAWTQRSGNDALHAPVETPPVAGAPAALPDTSGADQVDAYPAFLPPEARVVLDAIAAGGAYAYRQDGGVFQNRERLLPRQPRGYYHEFTVETPGSRDRGARRIITGGEPPVEYFYTDDHYRSFRRFELHGGRR